MNGCASQVLVVPPTAQLPLLLPPGGAFHLAPAPIGDSEPPLQTHALRNGGPAPLRYSLDVSPLAGLAAGSYGFEVLRYMGGAPLEGEWIVSGPAFVVELAAHNSSSQGKTWKHSPGLL